MIDLLKKLELVSAQVVGKDKKGKIVKMNLDHEDLEEIKNDISKLEKIKDDFFNDRCRLLDELEMYKMLCENKK